ncbi:MAG: ATPase [Muribaculaceae bacterium]|nr:ATPase [Muribaculaceae bacterium]
MKIVFDSGSTKTACALIGDTVVYTPPMRGHNAMTARDGDLYSMISAEKTLTEVRISTESVHFYGAGCATPQAIGRVREELTRMFPNAGISVESDMTGAARSLCGHTPGIACILGTGSNSCLWDGQRITANVPPLGFIIGDEGSGAVIGKVFLEHLLKGMLPKEIREDFQDRHGLTTADIITRVYRGDRPSAFLASFAPFIREWTDKEEAVACMVENELERFLIFNVERYPGAHDIPVSFTGSIARHFDQQLRAAMDRRGLLHGKTESDPLPGMVKWIAG